MLASPTFSYIPKLYRISTLFANIQTEYHDIPFVNITAAANAAVQKHGPYYDSIPFSEVSFHNGR